VEHSRAAASQARLSSSGAGVLKSLALGSQAHAATEAKQHCLKKQLLRKYKITTCVGAGLPLHYPVVVLD
jgi:hypothetical protein